MSVKKEIYTNLALASKSQGVIFINNYYLIAVTKQQTYFD